MNPVWWIMDEGRVRPVAGQIAAVASALLQVQPDSSIPAQAQDWGNVEKWPVRLLDMNIQELEKGLCSGLMNLGVEIVEHAQRKPSMMGMGSSCKP